MRVLHFRRRGDIAVFFEWTCVQVVCLYICACIKFQSMSIFSSGRVLIIIYFHCHSDFHSNGSILFEQDIQYRYCSRVFGGNGEQRVSCVAGQGHEEE